MLKKNPIVAIYSGNIPSTTFIENLIDALSNSGFVIYLFGKQTKDVSYKGSVEIYSTPVSQVSLILFVIKESFLLFLKNPKLLIKCFKSIGSKMKSSGAFFKKAGVLLPILNHQPDIFHIQWAKTVQQFPELFKLLKCKFALSLRGAHINYSPLSDLNLAKAYKKYFPVIDGFHAVSKAIGIESVKYGADSRKIKVINSSVKNNLFEKKAESYFKGETLQIISIGRHHWKKGYHYALDTMKLLRDRKIPFCYTLIAQGEIPEEIHFMMNDYQLNEEVEIINGLSYEKVIEKLSQSHILLLTSVEEGIANVVLEAMAVGVPVITTDCGGMNEVIDDKINGYIVPVRQPVRIAEKIFEFLETNHKVKSVLSEKAREKIKEDFSREKQVKDFSDFYHSLMVT